MGICHRELGNLESAVEYFSSGNNSSSGNNRNRAFFIFVAFIYIYVCSHTLAVEEMPDDLDAKMALAESYESLGENAKALEMVNSGEPFNLSSIFF